MTSFFCGVIFGLLAGFLSGIFVFKNNKAKADALSDLAKAEAEKLVDKVRK
jgi:hypothetical protein